MSNPISTVVVQISQTTASLVASPATGSLAMYANLTDHLIYVKNASGTSTVVGGGGGSSGTVTSVAAGTGLTGGTITTTGTIAIPASGVAAGTYSLATVVVNSLGLITSASTGSGAGGVSSVSAGTNMSFSTITTTGSIALSSTLTGTTLVSPVINGATASSGNLDFSGSSGTFKTPTGAATFGNSSYSLNAAFTGLHGWSIPSFCKYSGATGCATAATNATTGIQFVATTPITVTGIQFYWPGGLGAKTVRVRLYNATGTSLGNADVSVNAAEIYVGSITPVTIAAANTYNSYFATMWCTDAANYARTTNYLAIPGYNHTLASASAASYRSGFIFVQDFDMYGVGDAVPDTHTTTQYMLAEPVYTVP